MALTNKLTAIADAIRAKTGSTDPMTLDEMAAGIADIQTGGGDEELTTALLAAYSEGYPTINIPEGVINLRHHVCTNDTAVITVEGPLGLESIGQYAFSGCHQLTTAKFKDGLLTIGKYSFDECYKLVNLTLPDSVTTVEYYAFRDCTAAVLSKLPANLITLQESAFCWCRSLGLQSLPDKLATIEQNALRQAIGVAHLNIPASVTTIGECALANCSALKEVTFLGVPTSLSAKTFGDPNTIITTINVPWAEGEVANAPWGAANATINYNYTGE